MDNLARETILDYYRNPRNRGRLDNPTLSHQETNPTCGDVVRVEMQVEDGRVAQVRFDGRGCAISQAAASILTEMVEGKMLDEARHISEQQMLDALGIPLGHTRLKCALLGLKALKVGVNGNHTLDEDAL